MTPTDVHEQLDARLKTLLPAEYHESYEAMQPKPMGSAGMRYQMDGRVAWDAMWGSFCDLAMAGGPPHKGKLLEPGTEDAINADFDRYDEVVEEICRGIKMVSRLRAYPSPTPGWVSITCRSDAMAEWLVRAIAMENVSARRSGAVLELPAAPHFRIEKEIKNVITVIAKTCHYWVGHMPLEQQQAIGDLFQTLAAESPLVTPDDTDGRGSGKRRPCASNRRQHSAAHRPAVRRGDTCRLAGRRVPGCPISGVDDARAGRQQRAVAARRNGPVRAGQRLARPAR